MTVNSINAANTQTRQTGMNQATDSYSKNMQNQIANAQKQLQELSANADMDPEEKMKRRQEIQQQINDLNMQLRQHQIEQRKSARNNSEKQQTKSSSADDMHSGAKSTGLSQASMTAMISADASMQQARVQGNVATRMEGRAGVLKSEIKLDQASGGSTQRKEEELADVEQKAQTATASQLSTLADANRTMKEAAKTDSEDEKTTDAKKDSDKNVSTVSEAESTDTQTDASDSEETESETRVPRPAAYTSVDIRL